MTKTVKDLSEGYIPWIHEADKDRPVQDDRPQLQLPMPEYRMPVERVTPEESENRGVCVIDIF